MVVEFNNWISFYEKVKLLTDEKYYLDSEIGYEFVWNLIPNLID